jgi:hypothetical protein
MQKITDIIQPMIQRLIDHPKCPEHTRVELVKLVDMDKKDLKNLAGRNMQRAVETRGGDSRPAHMGFLLKRFARENSKKPLYKKIPMLILKANDKRAFCVPRFRYDKYGKSLHEIRKYQLGKRHYKRLTEKGIEYLKYTGESKDDFDLAGDPEFDAVLSGEGVME